MLLAAAGGERIQIGRDQAAVREQGAGECEDYSQQWTHNDIITLTTTRR